MKIDELPPLPNESVLGEFDVRISAQDKGVLQAEDREAHYVRGRARVTNLRLILMERSVLSSTADMVTFAIHLQPPRPTLTILSGAHRRFLLDRIQSFARPDDDEIQLQLAPDPPDSRLPRFILLRGDDTGEIARLINMPIES